MAEIKPLPLAPGTIRDCALAEVEHLVGLVERLSLSDWSGPSAVEGWTVGHVVAHLDLFLGIYNRLMGTVLTGGGAGTVVKMLGRLAGAVVPSAASMFDTINGAIPKVMDRVLGREVVTRQFVTGARTTRERLRRVGADDYTRPVYYEGGPYPLSFYLAVMVNELATHRWDIESELEEGADLSDDARHILPSFYWSSTKLMLRLPKGTEGTIQVVLSDIGEAMWWSVTDGGIKEGRGTTPHPDTNIRGPAGPYILTLAGRLKPAEVLHSSLAADGDSGLAERFLGSWHLI